MSRLIKDLERTSKNYLNQDDIKSCAIIESIISILRPELEWISVDERLPFDDCQCIGYYNDGMFGMKVEMFNFHLGRQEWTTVHGYYRTPTHWQPLPEPPEGE